MPIPPSRIVWLGEPERVEPARGSWTQVSERVPAVHDHRAGAIEHDAVQVGHQLAELSFTTGCRERGVPDVVLEVEGRIVYP